MFAEFTNGYEESYGSGATFHVADPSLPCVRRRVARLAATQSPVRRFWN